MTVFTAFNELEGADNVNPSYFNGAYPPINSTTGAVSGCRARMMPRGGSVEAFVPDAVTEFWAHVTITPPTSTGNGANGNVGDLIFLLDNLGTVIVNMRRTVTGTQNYQLFLDGVSVADIAALAGAGNALGTFNVDIHWKTDAVDGFVRFYINESLIYEFEGDTAALIDTRIDKFCICGTQGTTTSTSTSTNALFRNMMVADECTFRCGVDTLAITGYGAENEWAGVIGNVNNVDYNTSTYISSNLDDSNVLFAFTDMVNGLAAPYEIRLVQLSYDAVALASSPVTNIELLIYESATLTETAEIHALSETRALYHFRMEENPITLAPWTPANVNDYQFGIGARA